MDNEKDIVIWHNPRCSKSRQTLKLLEDRGIEPRIRRYLDDPPSEAELDRVLGLLSLEPRDLMRRKEAAYRDNQLDDPGLTRDQLIRAMHDNPVLIERPVVLAGGRAALGRPPEDVLGILD